MDSLDRIALDGRTHRWVAACLVATALLLQGAGVAQARSETLRWTHAAPDTVSAFRIYARSQGGSFGAPVYEGTPSRSSGVYTQSITVSDDATVVVAISALGDDDLESDFSNERTRRPVAPPEDDDSDNEVDDDFPVPDPNGALYRLNAGGSSYVDGSGRTWTPDGPYVGQGNKGFSTGDPSISGSTDDTLFQTHRFQFDESVPMRYQLPVPDGEYLVRLYFAEVYDGAAANGVRLFDISAEGELVVDDLDIYDEAGPDAAHVESILAVVDDGSLTVDLAYDQAWPPVLMALEVFEGDGGGDGGDVDVSTTKLDGRANLAGIERLKVADVGKSVEALELNLSVGDGVFMALDGKGMTLMGSVAPRAESGRDARKADLSLDPASLAIIKVAIEQHAASLGEVVTVLPNPFARLKVNRAKDQIKLLVTFQLRKGEAFGRYKLELKGPFIAN